MNRRHSQIRITTGLVKLSPQKVNYFYILTRERGESPTSTIIHLPFGNCASRQFTGQAFTDTLKNVNIQISMNGKGRALDNIMIERLRRSVKYGEIYLNEYPSANALRKSLKKYFYCHNTERPHQSFDGATPKEIYLGFPVPGKDGGVINPAEEKACALVDDSCGSVWTHSVRAETWAQAST